MTASPSVRSRFGLSNLSLNFSQPARSSHRHSRNFPVRQTLTLGGHTMEDIRDVDFDVLGELGQGTYGVVYKMRHRSSRRELAVKQMKRSWSNNSEGWRLSRMIFRELEIHIKCSSPHIVQCYGYIIKDTEVWICMELMESCFEKLLKKGPIPEDILGKLTVAIVSALHDLKEDHKVMHRDVKPSNFLISEDGVIKLCDLGISGVLRDSRAETRDAGCKAYLAVSLFDFRLF